jgi:acyl carrier protein
MKSRIFNRIASELSDPTKLSRAIDARKPVQHRMPDRYNAPRTELQQALASLWAEFLKVDLVGLDDNFFELGGHSLLAMQIGFQIGERFSVDFPLEAFLMTPVLRAQAEKIEEMLFRQANENELERLLAEIELESLGQEGLGRDHLERSGSYSLGQNLSGSVE